jgi:DNA-binding XRE family transcriptional regulator
MPLETSDTDAQIKDYRQKLGDTIRQVREKRGYSREQMAEEMNINCATIYKINFTIC